MEVDHFSIKSFLIEDSLEWALIKGNMQVLMLNDRIQSMRQLQSALAKAEDHLTRLAPDAPFSDFEFE